MSPNASPTVNKQFVPFKFCTSLLILIRRSAPQSQIFTQHFTRLKLMRINYNLPIRLGTFYRQNESIYISDVILSGFLHRSDSEKYFLLSEITDGDHHNNSFILERCRKTTRVGAHARWWA
jgi:hypothetical protein